MSIELTYSLLWIAGFFMGAGLAILIYELPRLKAELAKDKEVNLLQGIINEWQEKESPNHGE